MPRTRGYWHVRESSSLLEVADADGLRLAEVLPYAMPPTEALDNARFIADAPELYNALLNAVNIVTSNISPDSLTEEEQAQMYRALRLTVKHEE